MRFKQILSTWSATIRFTDEGSIRPSMAARWNTSLLQVNLCVEDTGVGISWATSNSCSGLSPRVSRNLQNTGAPESAW